jgi:hypothetical protein
MWEDIRWIKDRDKVLYITQVTIKRGGRDSFRTESNMERDILLLVKLNKI